MNDKEITNSELLESINRSFSNIETKITDLKLELKTDIHDFRMEMKSFKNDTEDSIQKITDDTADLTDTVMHQDKRIEKLETKVFPAI